MWWQHKINLSQHPADGCLERQKSGEEEATEAARMNAEAAAQEARDARNKTQTAAEKVQTAQREFEDKVARAQVKLEGTFSLLLYSPVAIHSMEEALCNKIPTRKGFRLSIEINSMSFCWLKIYTLDFF